MAATPTKLLTFAEFEQIPDDPRGWRQELHHGELVMSPPPKHGHKDTQHCLRRAIEPYVGGAWVIETEVGYRPVLDHEYWTADVALVSAARWSSAPRNGYLLGPPELVIEVLSPSNTASEMQEKRELCLENGAVQFWIVNENRRRIEIFTADGRAITFKSGDRIPLFFAPDKHVIVDDVFPAEQL